MAEEISMLDEAIRLAGNFKSSEVKGIILSVVTKNGGSITFAAGNLKGHKRTIQKAISDQTTDEPTTK